MRHSNVCGLVGYMFIMLIVSGTVMAGATKPAPTQKKPPSKVTFIEAPSSEKPAAREKRLKRECKGRPNAGMCLGYTR